LASLRIASVLTHVVRVGVGLFEIVRVVRRDERHSHPPGQFDRPLGTLPLDFQSAVLDFEIKPVAEDAAIPGGQLLGFVHPVAQEQERKLSRRAPREADEAFVVSRKEFFVDARLVVKTFQKRGRREPHEVLKADAVHRQEREVEAGFLHSRRPAVAAILGGDVGLVADDRIDVVGFALVVELERPVEVAVVGDRHRVHARGLHLGHERIDAVGPVKQAVVRVAVKMNEGAFTHGNPFQLV
jgi:hypothetical protein